MRKRLALALALLLIFAVAACGRCEGVAQTAQDGSEWPEIQAKAAFLADAHSGRCLYALNADEPLPIASTTKLMTALLAIENCSMDELVTASENASGVPGTSIYLGVGEQLTMHQMLEGLLIRSGNDAAVAIAEHVGGSVAGFAEMMNERAAQLGANAHFVNPNGLDAPGHLVSARGLFQIAQAAMRQPVFREIVLTKSAIIPWRDSPYDRVLTNKNRLLTQLPGATGIKTGFTSKAGRCLVFSAQRDGMELIGVLLNCGNWFEEAKELVEWGFANYRPQTVLAAGASCAQVPVVEGDGASVELVAQRALTVPLRAGESASLVVSAPEEVAAPIEALSALGKATVYVDGQAVDECDLLAARPVARKGFWSALKRLIRSWSTVPVI